MADTVIPVSSMMAELSSDDLSAFNAAGSTEDTGTDEVVESEPEPEVLDTPETIGDEPTEEPELEAEAEESEVEATETVKETKPAEDLPEGVASGKNRKGEDGYFVKSDRWKNSIYPAHQTLQKVSELIGEPATLEAITLRDQAYSLQERMYGDLISGDEAAQTAVLTDWITEMKSAQQRGEVGVDPTVTMAQAVYKTLKEKSPEGYANLRFTAAKDFIGEMYRYAAETGDKALWASAQHFSRALANVKEVSDIAQFRQTAQRAGIPFYSPEEMDGLARGAASDPTAQLREENARLQAELKGRSASNQAAMFDNWKRTVDQSIGNGITDEAIIPALAGVEAGWKQHQADYKQLVIDPLTAKVNEVIKSDSNFRQRIASMINSANRATSQQVRDTIANQIKQAHINRARLAVDAVKRPILEEAAKTLAGKSASTHARRQAAQNRTAPQSAGSVPRSVLPDNLGDMPNGVFDAKLAARQAARLLGV